MTINVRWKPLHKWVELMKLGRDVGISTVSMGIPCFWDEGEGEWRYDAVCGDFWAFPRLKSEWVWNESEKHVPDEWERSYLACRYVWRLYIGKWKKIQKKSSNGGEIPKNVIYRAIDLLNVKITINMVWKPLHKWVELMKFGRHLGIGTVSKVIPRFWNVDA